MLLLTVFVITWTTIINEVYSVMLVELPLDIEDGNWLIKAKLTDNEDSSLEINVDEYIKSANGTIRGKIVVQINNQKPFNVFYTSENQYERLFNGASFDYYVYRKDRKGWNGYITKLGNTIGTHLLLVGPSVVFRIDKFAPVWKYYDTSIIYRDTFDEGVKQHSATAALDPHLNVTFYYKGNSVEGLKRPTRAFFTGYDPKSKVLIDSTFWYDLYAIARVDQNFDTIVTPEPGIVCDKYFSQSSIKARAPLPKLTQQTIHFIAKTKSSNAGPAKKEQVYADEKYQIARIKTSTYGKDNETITTDIIYDYQLGVVYEFTETGNCSISPMDLSAPGLVEDSSLTYGIYKLDLNKLLNFNLNYRYLGPVLFDNREEIGIHAWEMNNINKVVSGEFYPKVVTTQYFSERTEDKQTDYTLVGTTLKAYDRDVRIKRSIKVQVLNDLIQYSGFAYQAYKGTLLSGTNRFRCSIAHSKALVK
uniref:Uncharacterized protein n=1 Tax=Tetranychus urticae TaxID=32264 RepID=T1K0A8_TETUR